jgi:integrase
MTDPLKIACRLLLVTAQRRGELAKARWADIDVQAATWTIPAEHSKNGKTHVVPLSRLALDLFSELRERTGYSPHLFPSPQNAKRPIIERSLSRAVHNNQSHFGLEPFTPHDLRRTAASLMTMLGVPRLHVSKVLNHAEDSVTAVYDRHDYVSEMRAALDQWARHLIVIVSGGESKIVPLQRRVEQRGKGPSRG